MSKYNTGYNPQHPWSTSRKNAQVRAMGRYNRLMVKISRKIGALNQNILSSSKKLNDLHTKLDKAMNRYAKLSGQVAYGIQDDHV